MRAFNGYTDPFLSPVSGRIPLPYEHVILGNEGNVSYFSKTILQDNLPDLLKSNIWLGIPFQNPDESFTSRPTAFDLSTLYTSGTYPSLVKIQLANPDDPDERQYVNFSQASVNNDYAYGQEPFVVLGQKGDVALPNAQSLNGLYSLAMIPNILKLSLQNPDPLDPEKLPFAKIEIAVPGFDFLTLAQLEEAEIVIVENAVTAVAEKIVGAVTGKIIEVVPDPEHPDVKVKKIETTFQDNARFPGDVSITIPIGGDTQRPDPTPEHPVTGMFRYNSDTNYFEGGYSDKWRKMYGEGKPTYITDTFKGQDNLFIGTQTGDFYDGGSSARNVGIGLNVMHFPRQEDVTFGVNPIENVAIGYNALTICDAPLTPSAARYNTAVGFESLFNSWSDYNVALGWRALKYAGATTNSVAIGDDALSWSGLSTSIPSMLFSRGHNVAVGSRAMTNLVMGSDNVAIGSGTLEYATNFSVTGLPLGYIDGSVAIGYRALQGISAEMFNIVTDGSVAIGHEALTYYSPFTSTPFGKPCIAIGYGALRQTRGGSSNLGIGYRSLFYLNFDIIPGAITAESRHIAIGDLASYNFSSSHAWTTQHPNLAIGVEALSKNNTGRGNVAVGDSALISVTGDSTPFVGKGGDFNTAVGYHADTRGDDAGTLTNAIAIGAYARVESSNSLVLGGTNHDDNVYYPDVGIGHNDPRYSLHIKNTGKEDKAIIALANTNTIPDHWVDNHLFFYASQGDAYVRSENLGSKKIGVQSVGTEHQIVIQDDPDDSTQKKISLAENPTLPGTKYVKIPGGSQAERDAIVSPQIGMIRFTIYEH